MKKERWIIGDSVDGEREFLVHLEQPRFVGRLVETDEEGFPTEEADTLTGITLSIRENLVLCEIRWFDAPPAEGGDALVDLLQSASEAISEHEIILEALYDPR